MPSIPARRKSRRFLLAMAASALSAVAANGQQPAVREYLADAPQIPVLSQGEAARVNLIIQAMVLADLKQKPALRSMGIDLAQNRREFVALGPEAIPALVKWMDYSANNYGTCPCTILGAKLAKSLEFGNGKEDLDTLEFVKKELGKGLTVKDPPASYKDLRNGVEKAIRRKEKSITTDLKGMKFDDVLQAAKSTKKLAEWRVTIGYIGTKKDEPRGFDLLAAMLDRAQTPDQRKAIHEALKEWSGVDKGPKGYESEGAAKTAAAAWQAWRSSPMETGTVGKDKK